MEGLIVVIPVNASTGVGLSDPKTYQNSKFIIVKCCNLSIHKITPISNKYTHIQPWWLDVFIRHVFHSVNSCF